MIRLICIDVDGTLLGAHGVSPRVWPLVTRARALGVKLALCSGRPGFGNTRALANEVEPGGWHIFQNGASVLHLGTSRSLSATHTPEAIAALVATARAKGRVLELYTDSDYAVESSGDRARRHAALLGLRFAPRPFEQLQGPVVRAQWLAPLEEERALLADPHDGLEVVPSTAPAMPDTVFVNLTPRGVSKGSAILALAREIGLPMSDVMFIGDGLNDLSALRVAGVPVAMATAPPEVLRASRLEVGSAEDGGVADAIAFALEGRAL